MADSRTTSQIAAAAKAGARYGVVVWGLYGILEFCFDSVFPLAYKPSHVLTNWHWMIGGVLLICYVLVGLAGGAVAGAASRGLGQRPEVARPAMALLMVAAFCYQCVYRGMAGDGRTVLIVGVVVGFLQLLTLLPSLQRGFFWRLAHPLVVAVVLAGFPVWLMAPGPDAAIAGPAPLSVGRNGRPDVILLVMDTVRFDHTSVFGYSRDTTPRLKELARQATRYPSAVAAGASSLPGHAAMFTGLYPRHAGIQAVGSPERRLPDKLPTIAELLREQGYATALVGANHAFLTRSFGMTQGFQTYQTPSLLANPFHLRRGFRRLFQKTLVWELQRIYASAETINQLVYARVEEFAAGPAPFFLAVNYMGAHAPFTAPEPFMSMYLDGAEPLSAGAFLALYDRQKAEKGNPTARQLGVIAAQYDAGIRYLDAQIGELFDFLRSIGRFDNTLLIVTSDHGDTNLESDHPGHGVDVCELETRIPLIVKYPHQKKASVVRTWVSHVDLAPTILDVVGAPAPSGLDGASLAALDADENRSVYAETYRGESVTRAVYTGDWKLVAWFDGTVDLFNLASDPLERHDLSAAEPARAAELGATLEQWLTSASQPVPRSEAIDERELKRLKDLGYVQ